VCKYNINAQIENRLLSSKPIQNIYLGRDLKFLFYNSEHLIDSAAYFFEIKVEVNKKGRLSNIDIVNRYSYNMDSIGISVLLDSMSTLFKRNLFSKYKGKTLIYRVLLRNHKIKNEDMVGSINNLSNTTFWLPIQNIDIVSIVKEENKNEQVIILPLLYIERLIFAKLIDRFSSPYPSVFDSIPKKSKMTHSK
ncbi:MAG: hypothetical protein DI598_01555, partial [Pseudopedobacter saltans]